MLRWKPSPTLRSGVRGLRRSPRCEAQAGERLGEQWRVMVAAVARTKAEPIARAVRDLLADGLSTLPTLLERENLPALHFYFATFDAPRRQLFPQALVAYEYFLKHGALDRLWQAIRDGKEYWLAVTRAMLAQYQTDEAGCRAAIEAQLSDTHVHEDLATCPSPASATSAGKN